MNASKFKKWATPLTIGTFIVSGVSGVLMFFKINFGLLRVAHEWISVLLVIACVFHIVANFNVFKNYFTSKLGFSIIAVLVVIGIVCFVTPSGSNAKPRFADYTSTLQDIPISLAAEIAKSDSQQVISHLSSHGVVVNNSDQTIREIANTNHNSSQNVLAIVFEKTLSSTNGFRH